MNHPTREEFRLLARKADLVPVYRELPADLETPVSLYLKLAGKSESFLLESVSGGEQRGRYSFIGTDPLLVFTARGERVRIRSAHGEKEFQAGGDALDALRQVLASNCTAELAGLPRFVGGVVGFVAYDMVRQFERIRTAPAGSYPAAAGVGEGDEPDAVFLLTGSLIAFDHVKQRALVIALARVDGDPNVGYDDALRRIDDITNRLQKPLPTSKARPCGNSHELQANVSPSEFAARVRTAQEHIAAGDIFQVVLSQRFNRETDAAPFDIYRALRRLNPSPYMFYLDFQDRQFIGSSPETLVRLENGTAELNPIAGTRRRGASEAEDAQLEAELRSDPKERAEHVMLVDLGRNDLGRVCEYGSVEVDEYMEVERFSHVMHLVSRVRGRLRAGLDGLDLLRATFPAGTVSGAPKIRAIEVIDELEGTRRGPYAGAVGYFGFPSREHGGNMDFCITIRTILMRGRQASIQAGAGIVADSIPAQEQEECLNKARALAEAIRMAENA